MTYQVMARKWRPQTFEEVVGQEHVTRTLQNALRTGRIGHAYLFSGPRGVGKTTVARILAKALNCQQGPTPTPCNQCPLCTEVTEDRSLDVLEIDGASHTGVDHIRKLREQIGYAPTHGRYRIYIIDEVHMLSDSAFNALLKTLEEPPKHVIFIFATTRPMDVLLTIQSRCQRFDFRRIPTRQITDRLVKIAAQENIQAEETALAMIARRAEGSMRDGQSLLEQVISYSGEKIDQEAVSQALGLASREVFFQLLDAIGAKDSKEVLQLVATVEEHGWDSEDFADGLGEHLRLLLLSKIDPQSPELVGISSPDAKRYLQQSAAFGEEDLLRMMSLTSQTERRLRYSRRPRFLLEMLAVKLAKMEATVQLGELLEDLDRILGRDRAAPAQPSSQRASREVAAERVPSKRAVETGPSKSSAIAQPTREAPPAPVGPPPAGETGDLWDQVIDRVTKKKSALGALLQHGQLGQIEERVVTIAFPKSCNFHRERAEMKNNREVIEGETSALLGRDVRIRFSLADIPERPLRLRTDIESKSAPPSAEKIIQSEPIIGDILENLDGELIT